MYKMLNKFLVAAGIFAASAAETIHGVVVFTRHGDRETRMFPGYQLTALGAQQAYRSGQFYRSRYVEDGADSRIAGIEPDRANARQIWASAPNQGLLFQTATNFLQGLYPPLAGVDENLALEVLANGTSVADPLNGYQFLLVQGQPETNEDSIWIKGDDSCPVHIAAQKSYLDSVEFKRVLNETRDFYSRFNSLLDGVISPDDVSYENAYDVFDAMNVASIHNVSVADQIDPSDLAQLRYLADQWEWNMNFNESMPDRMVGGATFAGGVLQRLNATVAAAARSNKFQLLSGSYDTFLSFFGLTNLTAAGDSFLGLPDYASTMAFELITSEGSVEDPAPFPTSDAINTDLGVRFLFRNGTEDAANLTAFPLFGGNDLVVPYGSFVESLASVAITSVPEWCTTCGSTRRFCVAANQTAGSQGENQKSSSGLSNAAAGGIGAGVAIAVMLLFAILFAIFWRMRRAPARTGEKGGSETDSA